MAWLHAIPEGGDKPRFEVTDYDLPFIDGVNDLLSHLSSIGFIRNVGQSLAGVTYQEIESWQRLTGVSLTFWEVETLFKMSTAYAGMAAKASSKECKAPFELETQSSRNKRIEDSIFG